MGETAADALRTVEHGVALVEKGSLEQALEQFEAATNEDLNCLEAYGWMSTALAKLGRFDEAHRNADHALWLDQFSAWAWNRKGVVYFEMKDWKMALTCFKRAVELEPGFLAASENVRRVEGLAAVNASFVGAKRRGKE